MVGGESTDSSINADRSFAPSRSQTSRMAAALQMDDFLDRATEGCIDAVHDLVRGDSGLDVHRSRLLAVGLVGASRVSAGHWLAAGRPIPRADAVSTTVALCWGGLAGIPRQAGDRPAAD